MSAKKNRARGSEKKRRIEEEKKEESRIGLAIVLVVVIVAAGAGWYFLSQGSASGPALTTSRQSTGTVSDPVSMCVSPGGQFAERIQLHLVIIINGSNYPIPANIGATQFCQHPIHTVDDTGVIRIDSPIPYPFPLRDFFSVWGAFPFDNTQLCVPDGCNQADATHAIRMTVNGVQNSQFGEYVMRDGDQILITYGSIG